MRPSLVFFLFASMISLGLGSQDQRVILDPLQWDGVGDYLSYFIRWLANDRSFMPIPEFWRDEGLVCSSGTLGPLNMMERARVTVFSSIKNAKTDLIVALKIPKLALNFKSCRYSRLNEFISGDVLSHSIVLNISVPLYQKKLGRSDSCKLNNVKIIMSPLNFKLPGGRGVDNALIAFIRRYTPLYQGELMNSVSAFVETLAVEAINKAQLCTYIQHLVE